MEHRVRCRVHVEVGGARGAHQCQGGHVWHAGIGLDAVTVFDLPIGVSTFHDEKISTFRRTMSTK